MNTLKIAKAVKEYLVQLAVNGDLTTNLTQLSEYKLGIAISEVLSHEIKALNDVLEKIKENTVSAYGPSLEEWNACEVVILEDFESGDEDAPEKTHYNKWVEDLEQIVKNFGTFKKEYITFSDGHKFEKVSETFTIHNWTLMDIYGINVSEETEALIESLEDIADFECFGIEITK